MSDYKMAFRFTVGKQWNTLASLQEDIKLYQEETFTRLITPTTRLISTYKAEHPDSNMNDELKYRELIISCKHGGRKYKSQATTGERPKQVTQKIGCKFRVRIIITSDGQALECLSTNPEHSHEISKLDYKFDPKIRKLDCETQKEIVNILLHDGDKKKVRHTYSQKTGKQILLKDLHNLAAKAKASVLHKNPETSEVRDLAEWLQREHPHIDVNFNINEEQQLTGYETSPRVKAMSRSPLSNHRQLVELLDPEPLLGYLLQNGALNENDIEILEAETSQAKTNLTLLKCLETNGQHAQNLLVNALRQTGQLHLASLLDEGIRIKTFTGSGYLSKKRHRGQLSLRIEIKALKFDQESVFSIINPVNKTPASREWVSVDDINRRISVLSESQTKLSSSVHFVEAADSSPKKSSCFCACFASLFSRKKKASKSASYISTTTPDSNGNGVNNHHINHSPSFGSNNGKRASSPNHYISRTTTHITSTGNSSKPSLQNSQQELAHPTNNRYSRTSIENLRNLLDLFHHKADEVCTILQETNCKTRDNVIKYFEQNRGVLVLDTEIGTDAFIINNICTKLQQVEPLRKDFASGQLSKDLEHRIVTEEILQKTGLLGIRLKAVVNQEELDVVEQELSS